MLVWSKNISTVLVTNLGTLCGSATYTDNYLQVEVDLLTHTATSTTVLINTTLASGATASWGITNTYVSPLTPTWPAMDIFNFGDNLHWNSVITQCGLWGNILGGAVNVSGTLTSVTSLSKRKYATEFQFFHKTFPLPYLQPQSTPTCRRTSTCRCS